MNGLCPQPAWTSWTGDGAPPTLPDHPEAYRLVRRAGRTEVESHSEVGDYRARSTLSQIERLEQLGHPVPDEFEVVDWPALDHRGVMLDVARGRVPTVATLEDLVERLAAMKVNHVELYLEATFDHPGHEEVCRPRDPYTVEDVRRLAEHARRHHVELVAQQNSLGHMEHWLAHPDFAGLAALPGGYRTPDGLGHEPPACLDPSLPGSWDLVAELVTNAADAFVAPRLHVGLDEPIDLSPGVWDAIFDVPGAVAPWKQVDDGAFCVPLPDDRKAQYLEWVRRLRSLPALDGVEMMMWADVVAPHPELLPDLPAGVTLVEWGYEADHPFAVRCGRLAAAGVPFWVAPGTSGWTSVSGRWSVMTANVAAAADAAVALGAQGLLVTSWLALPPVSDWPGFVWAAGLAWNPSRPPVLAEALDLLADGTAGLGQAWQLLGEVHDLVQPQPPEAGAVSEMFRTSGNAGVGLALGGMTQDMLDRVDESLAGAGRLLDAATPTSPAAALFVDELRWVADALRWGASATRWRLGWPGAPSGPLPLLEELDRLTAEESRLWHLRHRPAGHEQMASELARIREDVAHGDDHA